ncbi:MAG: flagellar biosynthesis protein FliQ [Oscillospiraceae bacterium]|nr:flagellar biosynthesis protein FliQ [Oscillospiraceae bacterium]MBP1567862.1 flagellar biosynthesis protein FliQ [Oscillospiraceae bacterium]MBP1590713.1 flagellar biosynthesis protein FliQ [Oscillospiraceae bacterium]MBQ5337200.1 flagellar biosynthesis protein FliQ [Oscillospiraceae bacterium]MBQ5990265.1 flagellar biosynthesis protein FliQ [Oscillospiraceae bacterium]
MTQEEILDLFMNAMYASFKLAAPVLIASIVIGLLVAIFQAATQIHEQTLTFVPKVLVIALMLLVLGSWMIRIVTEFFNMIFDKIAGM